MPAMSEPIDSASQYLAARALLGWQEPALPDPDWQPHPEAVPGFAEVSERLAGATQRIVLCDLFDTLIQRDVEATPVLEIKCAEFIRLLLLRLHLDKATAEIRQTFRQSIDDCISAAHDAGHGGEYQLREAIAKTIDRLGPGLPASDRARLADTTYRHYIEQEGRHCRAIAGAHEFLSALGQRGHRVIAVSDTPIDREAMGGLLSALGLARYFDAIYLSCEAGRNKRSGSIFTYLCEQEGIEPNGLIHIGDDPMADYVSARAAGIEAILLQHAAVKRQALATGRAYELAALTGSPHHLQFDQPRQLDPDPAFRLGRDHLGLLLGLFALRVHELDRRHDYDRILFVARDGHLLQQAFDSFVAHAGIGDTQSIQRKVVYAHLSRASTACPLSDEALGEALRYSTLIAGHSALLSLFESLGLDLAKYRGILLAAGFTEADFASADLDSQARLNACLTKPGPLRAAIAEDLFTKRERLLAYLRRIGMLGAKRVLLVDIGWRYRIAHNLHEALGGQPDFPEVHCALLGYTRELAAGPIVVHDGYAHDASRQNPLEKLFQQANDVIESICQAGDGSCLGYSAAGEPVVAPPCQDRAGIRERIQAGILARVAELARWHGRFGLGHEFKTHALAEFLGPIFMADHPLHAIVAQLHAAGPAISGTARDRPENAFMARLPGRIDIRFGGSEGTSLPAAHALERLLSLIQKSHFSDKPILIWGMGLVGKLIYPHLVDRIGYLADMNPALQGQRYGRHIITCPSRLDATVLQSHLVVFTPLGRELPDQLLQPGLNLDIVAAADWF